MFIRRWRPAVTELRCVCDEQSSGPKGLLLEAFSEAKGFAAQDCPFRVGHLVFEKSVEVLPLQAADVLAYETRKELANRLERPQRARSRALIHLLEHRTHVGFYVDHDTLIETRGDQILPPILYESLDARSALPWIEGGKRLDPPPILPS
jgi:hypothetical protein